MGSLIHTVNVINLLYIDSFLEIIVNFSVTNISNIITYIATILVTLTAIALPLTQQAFQWMTDKYDSEVLIKYINNKSPLSSGSIVTKVIIYMVLLLIYYLSHQALSVFYQALILFCMIAYFIYVVIIYALYFSYSFRTLSGTNSTYNDLIKKSKNILELSNEDIMALMELEKIRIKEKLEVEDLSSSTRKLGFNLLHLSKKNKTDKIYYYVNGLEKILYSIPASYPQEKHIKIANLLSYLSIQLLGDKKYSISLRVLGEIARKIESKRDYTYKPLMTGRIFSDLFAVKNKEYIDIGELSSYINNIVRLSSNDDNVETIKSLYENLCQSITYSHGRHFDLSYFFHQKIGFYLHNTTLSEDIDLLLDKKNIERKDVLDCLNKHGIGESDELTDFIDEFMGSLWDMKYHSIFNGVSQSFLYHLSNKEHYLLSLRDLNNPIKSDIHNISSDILPTNVDEIFKVILKSKDIELTNFWESPKEEILKSCALLFIYEVVKCNYNKQQASFNYQNITYSELASLPDYIDKTKIIIENSMLTTFVSSFIVNHYSSVDKIKNDAILLLDDIHTNVVKHKSYLECAGKIDESVPLRLMSTFKESIDENQMLKCMLRKVKGSNKCSVTYDMKFSRYTFLPNTGSYTDFKGLASSSVNQHLEIEMKRLLVANGSPFINSFPIDGSQAEHIILTPSMKNSLLNNNIRFENDNLMFWPDGSSATYFIVPLNGVSSYYFTNKRKPLFKYEVGESDIYNIKLIDLGEIIKFELTFNFTANI